MRTLLVPLFALLAACDGAIYPTGPYLPGAQGGNGETPTGAGGGMSPTDPMNPEVPITAVMPGDSPMRRLTNAQINNTVHQIIGTQFLPESVDLRALLTDESSVDFYQNQVSGQTANFTVVNRFMMMAQAVTAELKKATYPSVTTLFTCTPNGSPDDPVCMRQFIVSFGERAFRRQLEADEITDLLDMGAYIALRDNSFSAGIRTIIEAVLQSPSFLYRVELGANATAGAQRLSAYSLATRLAFLLTDRGPDDALLQAARNNTLLTDAELTAQVDRLLAMPHAQAATQEFFWQWLRINKLDVAVKDTAKYPLFTDQLVSSMREESRRLLVGHAFDPQADFFDVFDSKRASIDGALAKLYGVAGAADGSFVSVELPASRRGILGNASVLASAAKVDTTSPTERGLLVRRRLLCATLAPPAGANPVPPEPPANAGPMTQRQLEMQHTTNPACAGCHQLFDGIGFGMEKMDPIGAERTLDNGLPIDDSATLIADGQNAAFSGVAELGGLLKQSKTAELCFVRQWMQYATGRRLSGEDDNTARFVDREFQDSGRQYLALVKAYIMSDAFRSVTQ